ncbi:unnamed protein product [Oreochromis niloticus]|nr:unnamed protein product [Mustela putorius furo]
MWSASFQLKIVYKPCPILTVSPSWLSPGASVTLNCEVEHPSAGWSFYWYKAVHDLKTYSYEYYIYELLHDGNGTAQDSYIIHGQTHTAGYVCRAGRGDPEYHTDHSQPKFVWSAAQSQETSQTAATVQTMSQDENQQQIYSSLVHGDMNVYESCRSSENTGGRTDDYRNISLQLRSVGQRRKCDDPEETSDYHNVDPNSATGP